MAVNINIVNKHFIPPIIKKFLNVYEQKISDVIFSYIFSFHVVLTVRKYKCQNVVLPSESQSNKCLITI